jgi:hypothetical protein
MAERGEQSSRSERAQARLRFLRMMLAIVLAVVQLHFLAAATQTTPHAPSGLAWLDSLQSGADCSPAENDDDRTRARFCAICTVCGDTAGAAATPAAPILAAVTPLPPGGERPRGWRRRLQRAEGWASSWSAQSPPAPRSTQEAASASPMPTVPS